MTKAAARKGDKCTGHAGAPPRPNDQGSPDVFINGLAAHRKGDHWILHKDHDSILAQGSPTCFINGKNQGRVGDPVACGSKVATGSPNVFVGENSSSGSVDESSQDKPSVSSSGGISGIFRGFTTWSKFKPTGGGGYQVLDDDNNVIASDDGSPVEEIEPADISGKHLIWGKKVSAAFRAKVFRMATRLGMPEQDGANWLMAVMAYESCRTFSPSIKNPGSSATGLIQFMSSTARGLGTSTSALARMSAEQQLDWVYKYLRPYTGRMSKLEDVYLAVFTPAAMGKATSHVLYTRGQEAYTKNRGFDINGDGRITISEISSNVQSIFVEGQQSRNLWVDGQN